jgi:hypothetical protein
MLRLRDARTGKLTDVLPAGRRQLRILVYAPGPFGIGQVRAYLTADLLRRAAEISQMLPLVSDFLPAEADVTALREACDALNIHPPRDTFLGPVSAVSGILSGMPPFDVGVAAVSSRGATPGPPPVSSRGATPGPPPVSSRGATPGPPPVSPRGATPGPPPAAPGEIAGSARLWAQVPGDAGMVDTSAEPATVRLRLLQWGYGEPIADGGPGGEGFQDGDAAETLSRWRSLVAHWARSPSGAMSRPHADAIAGAFAVDLETPAALRILAALADDAGVPDGVKFETFAAADRLLGLDLARDVGK